MLYILITTCLVLDNFQDIRKQQYIFCINNIISLFNNFDNIKFIIIENNNNTNSYLDNFGIDVLYTNNNLINTNNKGIKEIADIKECINKYNINDDDFIVKITGRYIIKQDSIFLKELKNYDNIDCIIRYGNFYDLKSECKTDCITGLIGMKCKYIKNINVINDDDCIEWYWAKITSEMKKENIIEVRKLGLIMCPASYSYNIEI